jgi:hypothetical protein
MFSPIIRSTWLYLQYLVVFTQIAVLDELKLRTDQLIQDSDLGEYYQIL